MLPINLRIVDGEAVTGNVNVKTGKNRLCISALPVSITPDKLLVLLGCVYALKRYLGDIHRDTETMFENAQLFQ